MTIARLLRISGRVQGVGFRFYMQRKAAEAGVTGWVRNRLDGTVESLIEGSPEAVEKMTAWAQRGPSSAVVNGVRITETSPLGATEFEARPTE
jgi:acylphosphatase